MTRRVSLINGRKEPKTKASKRTWFRFRLRKEIPTQDDQLRSSKQEEISNKLKAMIGKGEKHELAKM